MEEEGRQKKVEAAREKLEAFQKRKNAQQPKRRKSKAKETETETRETDLAAGGDGLHISPVESESGQCSSSSNNAVKGDADWLHMRIQELEETLAGKDAELEAMREEAERTQESTVVEASVGMLSFGSDAQFEECRTRLQDYQAAVEDREEVIGKLSASLEEVVESRNVLQQQADHLAQEVSLLQRQLQAASELVQGHHWDSGIQPQDFLAVQNKVISLEAIIDIQEAALKEQAESITELTSALNTKNGELNKKSTELNHHKTTSAKEIQTLMRQVEELHQKSSFATTEQAAALVEHQSNMASLQAKLEEEFGLQLVSIKAQLRSQFEEEKEALLHAHKEQLASSQSSLDTYRAQVEQLVLRITDTSSMTEAQHVQDLQALRHQVDSLTRQLKDISEAKASVSKELTESKMTYKQHVDTLNAQLQESLKTEERLERKLQDCKLSHDTEVEMIKQSYDLELTSYKQKIDALNLRLQEAAEAENNLPKVLAAHRKALEEELHTYKAQVEKFNVMLTEVQEKHSQQLNEVTEANNARLNSLNAEIESLNDRLAGAVATIEMRNAELTMYKEKVQSLSLQFEQAVAKNASYEEEICSYKQQVTFLQQQLEDSRCAEKRHAEEITACEAQLSMYKDQLEVLSVKVTEEMILSEERHAANRQILEAEVASLKHNNDQLNLKLQQFSKGADSPGAEGQTLTRQLQEEVVSLKQKNDELNIKLQETARLNVGSLNGHLQTAVEEPFTAVSCNKETVSKQSTEYQTESVNPNIEARTPKSSTLTEEVEMKETELLIQLRALQDRIRLLEANEGEVEALKMKLLTAEEFASVLQAEIEQFASLKDKHALEIDNYENQINMLNAQVKSQDAELKKVYKLQSELEETSVTMEKHPEEVQALQIKLEHALQTEQRYIAEINDAKVALSACENKVEALMEEIGAKEKFKEHVNLQEMEISKLKTDLHSNVEGSGELGSVICNLNLKIEYLQALIHSNEVNITGKVSEISSYQAQLVSSEKQIQILQQKLEASEKVRQMASKDLESCEQQVKLLTEEIEKLKSHKEANHKKLDSTLDYKQQNDSLNEQLQAAHQELKERTHGFELELRNLTSQLVKRAGHCVDLQECVNQHKVQLSEMTQKLQEVETLSFSKETELLEVRTQFEECIAENKALQETLKQYKTQITDLFEKIQETTEASLTADVEYCEVQENFHRVVLIKDQLQKSLNEHISQTFELNQKLHEMTVTISNQEAKHQQTEEKLRQAVDLNNELREHLDQSKIQVDEITKQLDEKTEITNSKDKEISELQDMLQKTVSANVELQAMLDGSKTLTDELTYKLQETTKTNTDRENEFIEICNKLKQAQVVNTELQEAVKHLNADVFALKEQLKQKEEVISFKDAELQQAIKHNEDSPESLNHYKTRINEVMQKLDEMTQLKEKEHLESCEVLQKEVNENKKLQEILDMHKDKVSRLSQELEEKTLLVVDKDKELAIVFDKLALSDVTNKNLQDHLEQQSGKVLELTQMLEDYTKSISSKENEMLEIQHKVGQIVAKNETLEEQVANMTVSAMNMSHELQEATVRCLKLEGLIAGREELERALKEQIQLMEGEVAKIKLELEEAKEEIKCKTSMHQAAEAAKETLEKTMNEQVRCLETALVETHKKLERGEETVEGLVKKELLAARVEVEEDLASRIQELEAVLVTRQQEADSEKQQHLLKLAKAKELLKRLRVERDEILSKYRQLEEVRSQLNDEKEQLILEKTASEEKVAQLEEENLRLQQELVNNRQPSGQLSSSARKIRETTLEPRNSLVVLPFECELLPFDSVEERASVERAVELTSEQGSERCHDLERASVDDDAASQGSHLEQERGRLAALLEERDACEDQFREEVLQRCKELERTAVELCSTRAAVHDLELARLQLEGRVAVLEKQLAEAEARKERAEKRNPVEPFSEQKADRRECSEEFLSQEQMVCELRRQSLLLLTETERSRLCSHELQVLELEQDCTAKQLIASQVEVARLRAELGTLWSRWTEREQELSRTRQEVVLMRLDREQVLRAADVLTSSRETTPGEQGAEVTAQSKVEPEPSAGEDAESHGADEDVVQLQQKLEFILESNARLLAEREMLIERLQSQGVEKCMTDLCASQAAERAHSATLAELLGPVGALQGTLLRLKTQLLKKLSEKSQVESLLAKEREAYLQLQLQLRTAEGQLLEQDQISQELNRQKRILEESLLDIETRLQEKEEILESQRMSLEAAMRARELQLRVRRSCKAITPAETIIQTTRTEMDKAHAQAIARLKKIYQEQLVVREAELNAEHASQLAALQAQHAEQVN